MDEFIKNNYNIIETYEENEYQKIEMGTKINDSESIIVVNTIKKNNYSDDLKSQFEKSLHNLLYINETDEEIIIVTTYHDGITLNDYLKSSKSNSKIKYELAKNYLNSIMKYKNINNNFKKILVDRKQISIDNDNNLLLNELLLIPNNEKINFNQIEMLIGEVLGLLLPKDEFINSLLNEENSYKSIKEIKEAFDSNYTEPVEDKKNVVIPIAGNNNDSSLDKENSSFKPKKEEEIELSSLKFIDEDSSNNKLDYNYHDNDDKDNKKFIAAGFIVLIILSLAFLLTRIDYKGFFDSKSVEETQITFNTERNNSSFSFKAIVDEDDDYTYEWKFFANGEELATFDKKSINIEFKNEGSYTIQLRVKDKNGDWSKPYSEEIYYTKNEMEPLDENEATNEDETNEKLESYTITYETNNVTDDEDIKYSGNKSLKFDLSSGNTVGKIRLNDILMKKAVTLSLSIRSDNRNPIKVKFIGSSGNIEKFEKVLNHVPSLENNWEMLSFNINTSNVENLDIIVESEDSTIWIDDIDIKSYK